MPRNKLIANAFFHAGFVEAWGQGFEIIEESFKNAGLEVPQFVEEFSGVMVNIKREVFAAIQHGARIDDWTGKVVKGEDDTNDDAKKITDRQQLIYNILSIGGTSDDTKTTKSIAIKIGVSSRTIKRDLKVRQELGYIEHYGPARGGCCKVMIRIFRRQTMAFRRCGVKVLADEGSKIEVHRHNAAIEASEAMPFADELAV